MSVVSCLSFREAFDGVFVSRLSFRVAFGGVFVSRVQFILSFCVSFDIICNQTKGSLVKVLS